MSYTYIRVLEKLLDEITRVYMDSSLSFSEKLTYILGALQGIAEQVPPEYTNIDIVELEKEYQNFIMSLKEYTEGNTDTLYKSEKLDTVFRLLRELIKETTNTILRYSISSGGELES